MPEKRPAGLGIEHFNAGRFERAAACFRAALAAGDRAPGTTVFLAHALACAGRPREAARVLTALLKRRPGHLPASLALAGLLRRAPVEPWVPRAAAALRSRDAKVREALAAILRTHAEAAVAAGRWAEAERLLRRAPTGAVRRDLAAALRARARAELRAGRPETAAKTLSRAPRGREVRAELREVRRALDAARREREDAALARRSAAKAERVRRLSARGTVAALRAALRLAPGDRDLTRALAEALRSRGDLRQALQILPGDARIRRELVESLRSRGRALLADDPAAAEKVLREALRLAPRDEGTRREVAEALRARAWANESAGRLAEAERLLRAARGFDPAGAALGRRLAATLRERERAGEPGSVEDLRLREKLERLEGRLRARERTLALLLDAAPGRSIDRFKALMGLRRYDEALDLAELLLDDGPGQPEMWGLANPWDWEEWTSRTSRQRRLVKDLGRALSAPARRPWLAYYRVVLGAPGALERFGRLNAAARERYGWMYLMAGRICLIEGPVPKAEEWLAFAAAREPADWRANALLAEARLVLGRREAAYEEMERAARVVPPADEGLLLAWRAAFDLWLGEHEAALERLDRACALGSPHAYCWRGAALLKLGRTAEALEALDLALRLFPGDLEAYVWRAEARGALGRHEEALEDLRQPPLGVWVLVNRALTKAALSDHAGSKADFDALPPDLVARVERRLGPGPAVENGAARMTRVLEGFLSLARGWRREEYGQSLWLG